MLDFCAKPCYTKSMKKCKVCQIEKPYTEYHITKSRKDGFADECKCCRKERAKKLYEVNKEIIKAKTNAYKAANKENIKTKAKEYDSIHAEEIALRKALYNRRPDVKERQRNRLRNNKEHRNEYDRNKRATDIQFRLKCNLRTRFSNFLKGIGEQRGSAIRDLGCTIAEFIVHLETQFKPGMTWENYGSEWHIDHIKPLCLFDLTDKEQFKEAANYKNSQPLWAEENWKKNRKYEV